MTKNVKGPIIDADLSNPQDFYDWHQRWQQDEEKRERLAEVCRPPLPNRRDPNFSLVPPSLNSQWLCCPEHRALLAEIRIMEAWAKHFAYVYGIRDEDTYGMILSPFWLKEFKKRSGVK